MGENGLEIIPLVNHKSNDQTSPCSMCHFGEDNYRLYFFSSPLEVWEMGLGPGVELHQHQVGHVEALDEEDLCPGHPFWLDGYLSSTPMTMETPMGWNHQPHYQSWGETCKDRSKRWTVPVHLKWWFWSENDDRPFRASYGFRPGLVVPALDI